MKIDLHKTEDVLTAIDLACEKADLKPLVRHEVLTEAGQLLRLYTKQRLLKELRCESKE